jgi:hypothetical protein
MEALKGEAISDQEEVRGKPFADAGKPPEKARVRTYGL